MKSVEEQLLIVVGKRDIDTISAELVYGKHSEVRRHVRFRYEGEAFVCVTSVLVTFIPYIKAVTFTRPQYMRNQNSFPVEIQFEPGRRMALPNYARPEVMLLVDKGRLI